MVSAYWQVEPAEEDKEKRLSAQTMASHLFIFNTDASNVGTGAVLAQCDDEGI